MSAPFSGMILAAGYGTRLGSLSEERPKPMLPVCDRPLATWALRHLEYFGATQVMVNLHHLGDALRHELDAAQRGVQLTYSVEDSEILGTGGGVKKMAAAMPDVETFVVLNGKIVSDVDLNAAVAFHEERGALATMVLSPRENARAWGAIGVDAEGSLTRLVKMTREGRGDGGEHMFTGIHILSRGLIDAIPEGPCCILRSAYYELFAAGAPLSGYVHRGYFYEHSTPARYLQGNFNLLSSVAAPAWSPSLLRGVHPEARVAEGAEIDASALVAAGAIVESGACVGPLTVIGAGARVVADCTLSRSVVWPEARAEGNLELAIVGKTTSVQLNALDNPDAAPR